MTPTESAALPHETSRRLLLGLSRGSISPPAAPHYIYVRSFPAASGTRPPIRRSLPVALSLFEQVKVVPALAQICRASRPGRRNPARFQVGSAIVQRRVRSLCRAEVWRGKIEALAHAIHVGCRGNGSRRGDHA